MFLHHSYYCVYVYQPFNGMLLVIFKPPEGAQQSLVTYILVYLPVSSTVIDDPFLVYVMVVTPLSFWILPLTLRYTGADVAP